MEEFQGLYPKLIKQMDTREKEILSSLKMENLSYDDLLNRLAIMTLGFEEFGKQITQIIKEQEDVKQFLKQLSDSKKGAIKELDASFFRSRSTTKVTAMKSLLAGLKLQKKSLSTSGAIAKDKATGQAAKRDQIRSLWASGKYSSRDLCAEQECAALDMSLSTARKALRGTPDPT